MTNTNTNGVSNCCNEIVRPAEENPTRGQTNYLVCTACDKPCDITKNPQEPVSELVEKVKDATPYTRIRMTTPCSTCDGDIETHYCPCNAEISSEQCEMFAGMCEDCF